MLQAACLLAAALAGCADQSQPKAKEPAAASDQAVSLMDKPKSVVDEPKAAVEPSDQASDGWIPLFDGKTLGGWKVGMNADSFTVADGVLVVQGPRAHLFYDGKVENHDFKDFHFKAEVKTTAGANSGIYFHTRYQEVGWPKNCYEVQVNGTSDDRSKSGGLYNVRDVLVSPVKDNEWYTQEIIVRGERIISKINGETLVDYTKPDNATGTRKHTSGTFAIQAYRSIVYFRNIAVRTSTSSE